jgi:hypothetical protein
VHGIEDLGVHVVEAAQRFQGQVQVGFRIGGAGVGHVDAAHLDAVALLLDPFLEARFQAIAHRAVVHEELDHLDLLAGHLYRLRLGEGHVVDAVLRVRRRGEGRAGDGGGKQAGGGKAQETHGAIPLVV